jgi:tRNA threonylcarbamoyladenosine biosynthesis protein TsaE
LQKVLYSRSATLPEIGAVADDILQLLKEKKILLMQGDLGSGKTTFTKELLKRLGITQEITSPTFNLVNTYTGKSGEPFYHFDLYRIRHVEELEEIGFTEYLDSGHLCVIEWPEIALEFIREPALMLSISHGEHSRQYEVSGVI